MKLSKSPRAELCSRLAIMTTLFAVPACGGAQDTVEEPKSCAIQPGKADLEKQAEAARKNVEEAYQSLMRSTNAAQGLLDTLTEDNSNGASARDAEADALDGGMGSD